MYAANLRQPSGTLHSGNGFVVVCTGGDAAALFSLRGLWLNVAESIHRIPDHAAHIMYNNLDQRFLSPHCTACSG